MGAVSYITELMAGELLISLYLPKKKYFALIYIVGWIALGTAGYFIPTPHNKFFFLLMLLGYFMLTIFINFLALDTDIWKALFAGVVGYSAQHLAQQPKNFLLAWTYPMITQAFGDRAIEKRWYDFLLMLFFTLLTYFLVWLIFSRKLKKGIIDLDNKTFLFVGIMFLIFSVFLSGYSNSEELQSYGIEVSYASICCLLTLFLLQSLVKEKNLEHEIQILHLLQNKDKEHYEISKETINMVNRKYHDMKYVLNKEDAQMNPQEKENLKDSLEVYDSLYHTGNKALDVILTEKGLICCKDSITLSCICDGTQFSFMKESDIYILFGNVLDNAMEATLKLDKKEERRIGLKIQSKGSFVSVLAYNPYRGELKIVDGLPLTTKGDHLNHGYGMKSIQMLVEKYQGMMTIQTDNNIFYLEMLFKRNK